MATWNDLKAHIESNFKVDEDSGDLLRLFFSVGDGSRSQFVLVGRLSNDNTGEEWVGISSPIGPLGSFDLAEAARKAWEVLCGGIVVIGDLVYLHHSAPLINLDTNEFMRPLSIIVEHADRIEAQLRGADHF